MVRRCEGYRAGVIAGGSLITGEIKSSGVYRDLYRAMFRDNYVGMQYSFVQFFTEHLASHVFSKPIFSPFSSSG